jgi:hypothetical protein
MTESPKEVDREIDEELDGEEVTAEELREAQELAQSVDALLRNGHASEADNPVLDMAAMIQSSMAEASLLDHRRRRTLVDETILRRQVRRPQNRYQKKRGWKRVQRLEPLIALAACLLLVMGIYLMGPKGMGSQRQAVPSALLSRTGDGLLGQPIKKRGAASQRTHRLFSNRLEGFRRVLLSSRSRP